MTHTERRIYLIKALLAEQSIHSILEIPKEECEQKKLLRSLFNLRPPMNSTKEFLAIQDEYLQEEIRQKGITDLINLNMIQPEIYLWQGDITTLRCDAIVNAANSQMLGCFIPCHNCIDNAIHTFAGIQLHIECAKQMKQQGHEEKTGKAKITPAFNLPCKYIIHTVGPIISEHLTKKDEELLASCYRSCLELAEKNKIKSIAFCCISTGEFHFPNYRATEIAIQTINEYKVQTKSRMEVIFNVFKNKDASIYKTLLKKD